MSQSMQHRDRHEAEHLADRIMEQQRTAERRRQALHEQQQERLRQEHQLVTERLRASRRVDDPEESKTDGEGSVGPVGGSRGSQARRHRLEARLGQAEAARARLVASRAAKAGDHVAHARNLGAMSRAKREREVEVRREKLEERLRLADERRQLAWPQARSPRSPSGRAMPPPDHTGASNDRSSNATSSHTEVLPDGLGPDLMTTYDKSGIPLQQQSPPTLDEDTTGPQLLLRVDQFKRQVSIRKLQQAWRAFAGKHRTTRDLAMALVSSGVTSVVLPDANLSGVQPESLTVKADRGGGSVVPMPPATASIAVVGGLGPRSSATARPADEFEVFADAMSSSTTLKSAQVKFR